MTIRPLEKYETDAAAQTLAAAFAQDPLYQYFVEDVEKRHRFLERFMKFRIRYGLKKGMVLTTDDLKGVAICTPPQAVMSFGDVVMQGGFSAMASAGKQTMDRLMAFNKLDEEWQKEYVPGSHWSIGPLGVEPKKQGQGYGAALLKRILEHLDKNNASGVLLTQTRNNEALYQKYGFGTVHTQQMGKTEIENILMLRAGQKPE